MISVAVLHKVDIVMGNVSNARACEADGPVIMHAPIGWISITWRESRVQCSSSDDWGDWVGSSITVIRGG